MYYYLLALHSFTRWLVVISIIWSVIIAWRGWLGGRPFTVFDNRLRHITATIAHVQLILGLWLYFISPVVNYFLHHFHEALHQREVRFFGMEHSTMMLLAIVIITIGSALAKRAPTDTAKFKTMAIWYTIALVIILLNIPWGFSPIVSRPYFRFI